MIIISHEKNRIGILDIFKGHPGMTGVDGIRSRGIHQYNALLRQRIRIIKLDQIDKA
ncbi:Uncharacterised protein [Mycobacterium tuberculosis]|nr:Uncharacterised protein [Mycobacterium tuberculosis]